MKLQRIFKSDEAFLSYCDLVVENFRSWTVRHAGSLGYWGMDNSIEKLHYYSDMINLVSKIKCLYQEYSFEMEHSTHEKRSSLSDKMVQFQNIIKIVYNTQLKFIDEREYNIFNNFVEPLWKEYEKKSTSKEDVLATIQKINGNQKEKDDGLTK